MSTQYLIRLISSVEHNMSRDELMEIIRSSGTDRYTSGHKQQFDDFYRDFSVDFFAQETTRSSLEKTIEKMTKEFPEKTLGDRQSAIYPDIAIIYDAKKCRMIKNVYPNTEASDCYQFIKSPKDAFIEVRMI